MSPKNKFPKVAIIPLTYKCNAKCKMCNIWNQKQDDMSFEKIKEFCEDKLISENIESVNLTGGEPLLREELIDIVEHILKLCKNITSITLNTNGYFTDKYEAVLRSLCELKNIVKDYKIMVYLSIDGLENTHDMIRGIDGFFNHVMDTIDVLNRLKKELDFEFSINFTISQYNYKEMKAVFDFVVGKGLGIDFTYSMYSSIYFNNSNNCEIKDYDDATKQEICEKLKEFLASGKLSYSGSYYRNLISMINGSKRKIGCIFVDEGLFLHPSGDVFRCWAYDKKIGNIYDNSISDIWTCQSAQNSIQEITKQCEDCYNNCYVNFKRNDSIKKLINL